ncbi:alpha/beta-hydrolase [Pseudovirgaria hyperparasitica]|uniref:Alpha/beta-hydrolase n=1 Tax=Pseudovirgaria hyperparasitica TaxID=470096 RepID=A0A6A6WMZ6_9PEZI|nr:alpha/beta-hydrolase [Pseudovirgaria hyperparasitica]KAF2763518.1 alpha/beta-hydrolase [Pseudovirgaria hyperparasitica]
MKTSQPRLSIRGAIGLGYAAVCAIVTGLSYATWIPFENVSRRPKSTYKYIMFGLGRAFMRNLSREHEVWAMPTTDSAYETWCKKNAIVPRSDVLPDGTKAHWLGSKDADTVMLFFPGGGYNHPMTTEHVSFLNEHLTQINAKAPSPSRPILSVLILSYSLAPEHPYPRQLIQATDILHHTLSILELPPSRLILCGDSAGGGLIFCLLSHLLHPHPSNCVPRPPKLNVPFKGVALLSPWVNLATTSDSMRRNARKDGIEDISLARWGDAFLGGKERDAWNCPSVAESGWWKSLSAIARNVFIVVGGDEVMLDDINDMSAVLESECGDIIQSVVIPDECHNSPLVEKQFLRFDDVAMDTEYQMWLERLLWT